MSSWIKASFAASTTASMETWESAKAMLSRTVEPKRYGRWVTLPSWRRRELRSTSARVEPVVEDPSRDRAEQSEEEMRQGGFAGPRAAGDPHVLARMDDQGHLVDHPGARTRCLAPGRGSRAGARPAGARRRAGTPSASPAPPMESPLRWLIGWRGRSEPQNGRNPLLGCLFPGWLPARSIRSWIRPARGQRAVEPFEQLVENELLWSLG